MSWKTFIKRVAERNHTTQVEARRLIEAFLDEAACTVRDEGRLDLPHFGIFAVAERKARLVVHPNRPEERISLPVTRTVAFRARAEFKRKVRR